MFHTYYVIFNDFLHFFSPQNFKTKVLTAQKNLLLERLSGRKEVSSCDSFPEIQQEGGKTVATALITNGLPTMYDTLTC